MRRNEEFLQPNGMLWKKIEQYYRKDETECVNEILEKAALTPEYVQSIQKNAAVLVEKVREKRLAQSSLDTFMFQYDLSSDEGIALMCLAEALLRIPDKETIDKLIRDKLSQGNWRASLGKSHSFFVNAATWALMLTGKIVDVGSKEEQDHILTQTLKRLANKGGEPIVRKAILSAMKILGRQFVMGRNIASALKRAKSFEEKGYRFSYDMLGEAAYTAIDAEKYFNAYLNAIEAVGEASAGQGPVKGAGISVKLSALHPQFVLAKKEKLQKELLPKLKTLVTKAKTANIGLTIDAEEAHTLTISLELIEDIIESGLLGEWEGFGLAVQAYQKRAPHVIDWLIATISQHHVKMMIRLVKGAYWDTEIKLAQVQGLSGYPVFTRKVATDVNYIVCAKKLLSATDIIYPQFATHNAMTLATIQHIAKECNVVDYEFQCLHGMGASLYDEIVSTKTGLPCRIYAPVGTHEDLLAYLVRRLLENGANTSFVNRIADEKLPIADMVLDPVAKLKAYAVKPHPRIPLPSALFSPYRLNSKGLDLSDPFAFMPVFEQIEHFSKVRRTAGTAFKSTGEEVERFSPCNKDHVLGVVCQATPRQVEETLQNAHKAYETWQFSSSEARSQMLEKMADLIELHRGELMSLLVYEAGKTIDDAIAEIRESVDFCRYYAEQARKLLAEPMVMPGPTGEYNQLSLHSRGVIACISPWNFPLAIFLGQVTAALASGNCVVAKPASQTVLIGARAVELLHEAGFPQKVVQLLPGRGAVVGDPLIHDLRISGVVFTGSTETARHINQQLAARGGPITPFIAETGGQNAMIVDSSALSEQVTQDVLTSAFRSAGQRCSALRVLFIQNDVADRVLAMIQGAMAELKIGDPALLSTDMGPVIDEAARKELQLHAEKMKRIAKHLYETPLSPECKNGSFISAHLVEISSINILTEEVFGPILHVVRYNNNELDNVIEQINSTGYGLTLGVHSRINETIEKIVSKARVGNIYVNRNMIGAVVGVQPFGGERLSGTGPKAGGPHYLPRLATERALSINTTASGGNARLMNLDESE